MTLDGTSIDTFGASVTEMLNGTAESCGRTVKLPKTGVIDGFIPLENEEP